MVKPHERRYFDKGIGTELRRYTFQKMDTNRSLE
jgi:hypothetical protein